MMENIFARVEELATHLKEYINNRIDAAKLNAAEKTSKIVAGFFARTILVVFVSLFVLFGGVSLAFVLGEWTGRLYLGFLIVACLFLVMGLLVWTLRDKLIRIPMMNSILQQLYNEEKDEKD